MTSPFRIAIAGLGTVGAASLSLIRQQADMLASRCGRRIIVKAVSARSPKPNLALDGIEWVEDARALAQRADIDCVVELIGGAEGVARELVEAALASGKSVVTANKALIAQHGLGLARRAEGSGAALAFEAAVAGGIPVIDVLRHGLSANRFTRIAGILNGTCNYILTTMQRTGRDFADVLTEAQALGYAEADPSFDIDGIDTAHKLAILSSLAFGTPPDIAAVRVEGIRRLTHHDIAYIDELGYRVKLLGIAERRDGGLMQRVHPCLVAKDAPIARIDGAFNAVQIEGAACGRVLLEGAGAGGDATASAVVSDLVQLARGVRYPAFTLPAASLAALPAASMDEHISGYYLRLSVDDKPGVLAEITAIFADERMSVQSIIQHTHAAGSPAQVVITTHETKESAMLSGLQRIASLASVVHQPQMLRIERF